MPRHAVSGLVCALLLGCATSGAPNATPTPERYRLAHSGDHWSEVGDDHILDDLQPRYPEFFELILDPSRTEEGNLRLVRDDLEHKPVDRRNFDALNSLAIAYFEINYRAEAQRGEGLGYMSQSFRSAKLAAVPWRAYGETDDAALRGAILDFFQDAASGEKLGSRMTAPRLTRVVESLERKETDPARLRRIESIVAGLQALAAQIVAEQEAEMSGPE